MSLATSIWSPISGGITEPLGFQAAGIRAGLKSSGKRDLAIVLAPEGSVCAGSFTQSLIRAACVDLCIDRLNLTSGKIRAVLINSGQANACTGDLALIDSLSATNSLAQNLGLKPEEILLCSTGVIGEPIPMKNLLSGIQPLINELSRNGGQSAAEAILTTDLVEKQIAFQADLGGRCVRLGGMAKGSGMIHPQMATMLGYISCDAGVSFNTWKGIINRVVQRSFNAITVDGDTSTNDSVIAFASGDYLDIDYLDDLEIGLTLVAQYLAKAIARDGEGANCLIEVTVQGASTEQEAIIIGRTICSSSLVKTAIHGCDPNWGRILAAAGRAGVYFNPQDVNLWIGTFQLLQNGEPVNFDRIAVTAYMEERMKGRYLHDDIIQIILTIGNGNGKGIAWGCDLSDQYIRINSDYTT